MSYKFDLLQLKQGVFWNLTYSRSEANNDLKISLEVMKLVYLHTTYVLYVLIMSKHNLHKILNFVYLPSTYILSVPYLNSKHDSR